MKSKAILLTATVMATVAMAGTNSFDRPLVRFAFDEVSGSYCDDPDSGRTAVLTPAANWATGTFGGALATGMVGAGADIASLTELDGTEACTFFLRFRKEGKGVGAHPCLLSSSKWADGGILFYAPDSGVSVRMRAGVKGPEKSWTAFAKMPERRWSSVALVFRKPDVVVYADGKPVARGSWHYPFRLGGSLRLGAWGYDSFGGFIDDFRVWKRALAPNEIADISADVRYDEIEGYQDDGTGGVCKTEIVGQSGRPLLTLAGESATVVFDTFGALCSLREKTTGRELVANVQPFVRVTRTDETHMVARWLRKQDDGRLVWSFPSSMGEIEMSVKPFRGGWTFQVERCTLKDVKSFEFCCVTPVCSRWKGSFVNAWSDERSAVCVRSYDLEGTPKSDVGRLCVSVDAPFLPTGRRAGLVAGSRDGFREQLKAMTVEAGVPRSDCGGAWSMESEVARRSYVFATVQKGDIDYWIDFVRRAGFSIIHNQSWTSLLGPYPIRAGAFPDGLAGMKVCMDKVHAAGLHTGLHTLTACIDPHAEWISPVCNEDLVADATYTLAEPLGDESAELLVVEKPIPRHATVFTYSSSGNVLRIGNELLQYSGIRRDKPPYAFTGLRRGAFGTRKGGPYPVRTKVDYVHQRYSAFFPKPGSTLAETLAGRLAEVYNTCNLDEIYFDGSEGMGTRYGIDFMRHLIYSKLKPNNGHSPSVEASCEGANNWWFQTRMSTVDHPVFAVKRFHDWHLDWAIDRGRRSNFLEPQMGWWQPRTNVPEARGHMLDEMEYFAGKNAGHDAAMSIQGVSSRPLPFGVRSQLTLLGWYEYPRLARAFAPEAVVRLAEPRAEARLRQNSDGIWELTDIEATSHRFGFPWDRAWSFKNGAACPAALRVEALHGTVPDVSGVTLLKKVDFAALTQRTAKGVVAELTTAVHSDLGPAFRLSAKNQTAQQTAAWAEARREFAFPGVDLGANCLAFGTWIKGDGSGALLSLVFETPSEFHGGISMHHVRLDFTGWRQIAVLLRERDVDDYLRYQWPFGGICAVYRTFVNPCHIGTFSMFLNDVPTGHSTTVEIGEIRALTMTSNRLKKVAVKVNGASFAVPFAMESGEYAELDGGAWTHYSALGTPLARRPEENVPKLGAGCNTVELVGDESTRAEISLFALGRTRPALVDDLTPEMRKRMRFEGVMPFVYAPDKGLVAPRAIAVRPGEKADLSLEIYGPATNPTFTFSRFLGFIKEICVFPVLIGADERLVCRDGRNWKVEKAADGTLVCEGSLENPLPTLEKTTPFTFSTQLTPGTSCTVDLLKVYR